jgi:hypothetical protein
LETALTALIGRVATVLAALIGRVATVLPALSRKLKGFLRREPILS